MSVLLKEEAPKPLVIYYRGGGQQAMKEAPHVPTPKLVVKVPAPFRYTSDKTVPWNYSSQAVVQEPQAAVEQKPEKSVNDIVGTGGMTRSGRCYAPINPKTKEGESSAANERTKIAAPKGKVPMNESVTEKETEEFLKFIKHHISFSALGNKNHSCPSLYVRTQGFLSLCS